MFGNATSLKEWSSTLEGAALSGGGVTDPGGVQGTFRCCTKNV